jgi:hypothetical protein
MKARKLNVKLIFEGEPDKYFRVGHGHDTSQWFYTCPNTTKEYEPVTKRFDRIWNKWECLDYKIAKLKWG